MRKKRYMEWVREYPEYLVIRKEGYFYTVRDDAAELISGLVGYKTGKAYGHIVTGSPSLKKILVALEDSEINYIIIEDNQIVEMKNYRNVHKWEE